MVIAILLFAIVQGTVNGFPLSNLLTKSLILQIAASANISSRQESIVPRAVSFLAP